MPTLTTFTRSAQTSQRVTKTLAAPTQAEVCAPRETTYKPYAAPCLPTIVRVRLGLAALEERRARKALWFARAHVAALHLQCAEGHLRAAYAVMEARLGPGQYDEVVLMADLLHHMADIGTQLELIS